MSVVGLSLLMPGAEKTLSCVLGGVLSLVVNGMLSGTPSETINKRPNGGVRDNKTHTEINADLGRTLGIPPFMRKTGEEP